MGSIPITRSIFSIATGAHDNAARWLFYFIGAMEILLNGEAYTLPEGSSVARLIDDLALEAGRLAVEVNLEVVPRSEHADLLLRPGDRVEVVHAIGGGELDPALALAPF